MDVLVAINVICGESVEVVNLFREHDEPSLRATLRVNC